MMVKLLPFSGTECYTTPMIVICSRVIMVPPPPPPHKIGLQQCTKMQIDYSSMINNDWISEQYKTERGVRQGCPLSPLWPYLFIPAAEV